MSRSAVLFPFVAVLHVACASSVVTPAPDSGNPTAQDAAPSDAQAVLPDGPVSPVDVVTVDRAPPAEDAPGPGRDAMVVTRDVIPFPVATDGATIYPADAGYTPGVVTCGSATCTSTEECCVDPRTRALSCVPTGTCGSVSLGCDGPEDCMTGQTCCVQDIRNPAVACHAASECGMVPLVGTLTACHTDTDCGGAGNCCNVSGRSLFGFTFPDNLPALCLRFRCP